MKKNISILILLVTTITLSLFLYLDKIDNHWIQKYPFQWYDQGIFDILNIRDWENIKILDKYHRISLNQLPTKIHNNYTHEKTPIGSIELQKKLWIHKYNEYLKDWKILIVSSFNFPPNYITHEEQISFYWNRQDIYSTGSIISYNNYAQIEVKWNNENIINLYPVNEKIRGWYSQTIDSLNPDIILYDTILLPNNLEIIINNQAYYPEMKYKIIYNHPNDIEKFSLIPYYELTLNLKQGKYDLYYQYFKYEKNIGSITIEWK